MVQAKCQASRKLKLAWQNDNLRFSVSGGLTVVISHVTGAHTGREACVNRVKQQICRSSLAAVLNLFSSGNCIGRLRVITMRKPDFIKIEKSNFRWRKSGFLAVIPHSLHPYFRQPYKLRSIRKGCIFERGIPSFVSPNLIA